MEECPALSKHLVLQAADAGIDQLLFETAFTEAEDQVHGDYAADGPAELDQLAAPQGRRVTLPMTAQPRLEVILYDLSARRVTAKSTSSRASSSSQRGPSLAVISASRAGRRRG
mgnify:CR=1 FL=1